MCLIRKAFRPVLGIARSEAVLLRQLDADGFVVTGSVTATAWSSVTFLAFDRGPLSTSVADSRRTPRRCHRRCSPTNPCWTSALIAGHRTEDPRRATRSASSPANDTTLV